MTQSNLDLNIIFNDSYAAILEDEDRFYHLFYENFIASSAFAKEIFKDKNIQTQSHFLKKAIAYLVDFSTTKIANEYLCRLADVHQNLMHIEAMHYELFMKALLMTLKQFYPNYNHSCGLAWRVVLAPGLELMKHGRSPVNK